MRVRGGRFCIRVHASHHVHLRSSQNTATKFVLVHKEISDLRRFVSFAYASSGNGKAAAK